MFNELQSLFVDEHSLNLIAGFSNKLVELLTFFDDKNFKGGSADRKIAIDALIEILEKEKLNEFAGDGCKD